jgi:hypothetical protein
MNVTAGPLIHSGPFDTCQLPASVARRFCDGTDVFGSWLSARSMRSRMINTTRRVTSNPVDEVCVCEQQGAPRVDRLYSRNPRHERKPSPDRHPSASAAEEEAEQAARADCGGSSRRTCRARSEGAAHIFTLPQAGSEAGTAARGLVATVNAACTRRATVSEFHRASGLAQRLLRLFLQNALIERHLWRNARLNRLGSQTERCHIVFPALVKNGAVTDV